jgi:hypothetical protein
MANQARFIFQGGPHNGTVTLTKQEAFSLTTAMNVAIRKLWFTAEEELAAGKSPVGASVMSQVGNGYYSIVSASQRDGILRVTCQHSDQPGRRL